MSSNSRTAIFIDRDGVVNRRRVGDYVKRWEEFEFLPGIFEALPEIHGHGLLAVLITNQRGIGRGLMSEADLESVHEAMQRELERRTGQRIDAIYHCPHDRDDGCDCRKPMPGMLLQAAREHGIDLEGSWMIGDSESDVEAGIAAGCRTVRIGEEDVQTRADMTAADLLDALNRLVAARAFR